MPNTAAFKALIQSRIQDVDSVLTDPDLDDVLQEAIDEYSERFPARGIYDILGDGSTVAFDVPNDWQELWSRVLSVEIGVDSGEFAIRARYEIKLNGAAGSEQLQIVFTDPPVSGQTYRVRYTRSQMADTVSTSVPTRHHRALSTLGAAIGLQWIANHYAAQSDPSFGADTADHTSRSDRYSERAEEMRERYDEMVKWHRATRAEVVRV